MEKVCLLLYHAEMTERIWMKITYKAFIPFVEDLAAICK